MPKKQELTVEGRKIPLTNLDKVLFPAAHFTKGQVIDYYIRMADFILPHLRDRPVTLKRFPNGVGGEFFYEKDAPKFTPDWVRTFPVPRRDRSHTDINYIVIDDLPTLVWSGNLANLEIHPFLHRVPHLDRPTAIVFDLDPGEGMNVLDCARVAFFVRELLAEVGLKTFAKVSGSKGLQIYVPLNVSNASYDLTQPFAKAIAQLMEERHKDLVVSKMAKVSRARKIFIDWSQNADFKTTVGVYSLRAKSAQPFVSMPVEWEELEAAVKTNNTERLYFKPEAALDRLKKTGDLFKPVLSLRQKLPKELLKKIPTIGSKAQARVPASLQEYERKRDFRKTKEPAPAPVRRSRQGSARRFVIQKHAASHLHYDFRLEMHDTLKSWAVPKGPPFQVGEKRLAMPTEDHPVSYLDFEGTIPKGQYGGGTVMVWDIGTYELMEGNYYRGYLHFFLSGRKLKGEWQLIRGRARQGDREIWYLGKIASSMRPLSKKKDDESAITGRTMEQIRTSADAVWESNRGSKADEGAALASALPDSKLQFVPPMLARLVQKVPAGKNWMYEVKLDGYRVLAIKKDKEVTLYSRRGNVMNARFPAIAKALGALPEGTMVDGEVVALDDEGRPSFSALQNVQSTRLPLFFYAFDILAYRGKDLRKLPLSDRRAILEDAVVANAQDPIRISESFEADPDDLIPAFKQNGLEGLIAKRLDSIYEAGERSGAWSKYKTNQSQEFVVGGYKSGSYGFEYLLAGYYEGRDLIFVGKIKNGFVPALRRQVMEHFKGLETDTCPFANLPEPKNARRGEALTAEVMKKCRWLKPKLVAQIEFTEWTEGNHLRHSRFAGLRDDKIAREVIREKAA